MSNQFTLKVNQKNLGNATDNEGFVEGISYIKTTSTDKPVIFVRQGKNVILYEYDAGSDKWNVAVRQATFDLPGQLDYPQRTYPWVISDILGSDNNIIMMRTNTEMAFYSPKLDKKELESINRDGRFHDVYGWDNYNQTILFGKFLNYKDYVHILARNRTTTTNFHVASKQTVLETQLPVNDVQPPPPELTPTWSEDSTEFHLTNLDKDPEQQCIVLHTPKGLEVYKFYQDDKGDDHVKNILETSAIKKMGLRDTSLTGEKIFFTDLTNQKYQDIVYLNDTGLFIYQYNEGENNYLPYHFHAEFSKYFGWQTDFTKSLNMMDITGDNIDDILYTGPKGLSAMEFNNKDRVWQTILNPETAYGLERYASVVGFSSPKLSSKVTKTSLFIQDTENTIDWGTLQPSSQQSDKTTFLNSFKKLVSAPTPQITSSYAATPEVIAKQAVPEVETLRWLEQFDDTYLQNAVDIASGQVRFTFPLIKIATPLGGISLALNYNTQENAFDVSGMGWAFSGTVNFIMADYSDSVLPKDAKYYISSYTGVVELRKRQSTDNELIFYVKDEDDIEIRYDKTKESWTFTSKNEIATYGKNDKTEAIQWSLGWKNWRGLGKDVSSLNKLAVAWYLIDRKSRFGEQRLSYTYDSLSSTIDSSKSYTMSVRLTGIESSNGAKITIDYDQRNSNEYETVDPKDADGNYQFPVPLIHTHFITGYTAITTNYQQKVSFTYDVQNNKRLLTEIVQVIDGKNESLLKMKYQAIPTDYVITECTLAHGSVVQFNFEAGNVIIPQTYPDIIESYAHDTPTIIMGTNYTLMGFKEVQKSDNKAFKVKVQILNLQTSEMVKEFESDTSSSEIKSFQLQPYNDFFALLTNANDDKQLYLYQRHNDTWDATPKNFKYGKEALVKFGNSMIAVAEPKSTSVTVLEYDNDLTAFNTTKLDTPPVLRLAAQDRLVVGYDDSQVWMQYRNENENKWNSKIIDNNLQSWVTNSNNMVNSFDLPDDTLKILQSGVDDDGLQLYNNLISISSVEIANNKLNGNVKLYLLDENFNVADSHPQQFPRETLVDGVTETLENDGSFITLGYYLEDGKYKVHVVKIDGEIAKDKTEAEKKEIIKQINDDDEWKKVFKERILFNWNAYYRFQLTKQGAYCGNDTLIEYSGSSWSSSEVPKLQTIRLGKDFIIEGADSYTTQYQLYRQDANHEKTGSPLKTIDLYKAGNLINRYPAYLAYQKSSTEAVAITFEDRQTLGPEFSYPDDNLVFTSTMYNLVSTTNETSRAESYLTHRRPLTTFMPKHKQPLITAAKFIDGDITRSKTYERTAEMDQVTREFNENFIVIPAGDKNNFGWYDINRVTYPNKTITTTNKAYNSGGNFTIVPPEENKDDTPDDYESTDSTLFDTTGQWLISSFAPYTFSNETVAYYGFESYEINKIGAVANDTQIPIKTWSFNENNIVSGKFAFTGENYLHLDGSKDESLKGEFIPKDQNDVYVASCWLKSTVDLQLNTTATNLKAVLNSNHNEEIIGLLSTVKRKIGDWSYLEVVIDFSLVDQIYQEFKNHSGSTVPPDTIFTINLEVNADKNEQVDLDHIRFTPIVQDLEVTVFNPVTGSATAVIKGDGSLIRNYYSNMNREIATSRLDGQIERLSAGTITGQFASASGSKIPKQPSNNFKIEVESGSHEIFDAYALKYRWEIENISAWQTGSDQLWHTSGTKHQIKILPNIINKSSAAIRFEFSLNEANSLLTLIWAENTLKIERKSEKSSTITLKSTSETSVSALPVSGEIIVLLEKTRFVLWMNSILLFDQGITFKASQAGDVQPWNTFAIDAQGETLIANMFLLNNPNIEIQFLNIWGEKTQVINLVDENTIQIQQTLYDELGRDAIVTQKSRITRDANQSLLAYYPDFVTNINPSDSNSVWKTGKMEGLVDSLNPNDNGYPYSQTEFDKSPLSNKRILGLPGADFSIKGRYAKKLSEDSEVSFMINLFPTKNGFTQKVEISPNGSKRVVIYDKVNNEVAYYVRVPGFDHQLTTYEYDTDQRLLKILPPNYHEAAETKKQTTPYQPGEDHLTSEQKTLQRLLCTHLAYDDNNNLIRKQMPDSGTMEFLYTEKNQRRFMVTMNNDNSVNQVTFLYYDVYGQLNRTGYLTEVMPIEELKTYLGDKELPNAVTYQNFQNVNADGNIVYRGKQKRFTTYFGEDPVAEELTYNDEQYVISKKTFALPGVTDSDALTVMEKTYKLDKIDSLTYPIPIKDEPLKLTYTYNKRGQLTGLGIPGSPEQFMKLTYHGTGQLATEQYLPQSIYNFTRTYDYNSPGLLEKLSDPYLDQTISYTDGGYGQDGYGDGIIMRTTFDAKWTGNADGRAFRLQEDIDSDIKYSGLCIKFLKHIDVLTSLGRPKKMYIRNAETSMPAVCAGNTGLRLATDVAQKQVPSHYGHSYAYGNHRELIKAKYFTDDTKDLIAPLQPETFKTEISGITIEQSHDIWKSLTDAKFIISDQLLSDWTSAIGKRGDSFLRDKDLEAELTTLSDNNNDFTLYSAQIKRLSTAIIGAKSTLTEEAFKNAFLSWKGYDESTPKALVTDAEAQAKKIFDGLSSKDLLPTDQSKTLKVLNQEFVKALTNYTTYVPDIVNTLYTKFSYAVGETAFDVEAYDIDPNGNQRYYYTGFDSYDLKYTNNTNKIEEIILNRYTTLEQKFKMSYDIEGSVKMAEHKGIKNIEYNPTSQRTTSIELTDGRKVEFFYDAQGERVIKRVRASNGDVSKETQYLRDEEGRVLVDRKTTYYPSPLPNKQVVTVYFYGTRGLFGFLRDNEFYSVITDHTGSPRLVVKNGLVVSAYDYMPYGQMMRRYGYDEDGAIDYLYNGQELDEETGLYNYHARFYDPSIGRFYQVDPEAQYFSPYKYAGNSPVSYIDPDGQFAFLIFCIVMAVVGAYLGAAAANNSWNPAKWDFTSASTYLGLFGGALAGGFLPVGFVASVGAIGITATIVVGVGGAYLMTAAANNNWDPTKWEWDKPGTWSALFQGFGTGVGLVGGITGVHEFAKTITIFGNAGKTIFLTASYTVGAGIAYGAAIVANDGNPAFWEWDWSNPGTWAALVDGFDTGFGWPQNIVVSGRGLVKLAKKSGRFIQSLGKVKPPNFNQMLKILKNPKNPLYKAVFITVMAYVMGSAANDDFDITNWGNSFSTYQGVISGIFLGKDLAGLLTFRQFSATLEIEHSIATDEPHIWSREFGGVATDAVGISFQRIMTEFSELKNTNTNKQGPIENGPPSARERIARTLYEVGINEWLRSNPPAEDLKIFDDIVSSGEVNSINGAINEREVARIREEIQRTIYPDRDAEFLGCSLLRRRKRGLGGGKACKISKQSEYSDHPDRFVENPDVFIQNKPISTYDISNVKPGVPPLTNGKEYSFTVRKLDSGGYSLQAADPVTGDHAVRGYWLNTKEKIVIKADSTVRYIFTGELQGCTLYVKRLDNGDLEVFHHLRHYYPDGHIDPEKIKFDKEYPVRLESETYEANPDISFTHNFVTPFVFKDFNTGNWAFAYQNIKYRLNLLANPGVSEKIKDLSITGKGKTLPISFNPPSQKLVTASRKKRHVSDKQQINKSHQQPELITEHGKPKEINKRSTDEQINIKNSENLYVQSATSGAGNIPLWPFNMAKSIIKVLNYWNSDKKPSTESIESTTNYDEYGMKPLRSYEDNNNYKMKEPQIHNTPSILEMGDEWLEKADTQGNLMWATLLIRKLTGRNPIPEPQESIKPFVEIEIESNDIVEKYIQSLLKIAISCGIVVQIREIIKKSNLDKIIKMVTKNVSERKMELIPELLTDNIVKKHLSTIAFMSTEKQANKLLNLVIKNEPIFTADLLKIEHKIWATSAKCNEKVDNIKTCPQQLLDHKSNSKHPEKLTSIPNSLIN